jgi:hypothetical protein
MLPAKWVAVPPEAHVCVPPECWITYYCFIYYPRPKSVQFLKTAWWVLSRKYVAAIPTEALVPLDWFMNIFLTWWCYFTELRYSCGFHGHKAGHFHSKSKHCRNHAMEILMSRFVYCPQTHLSFTHTIAHSLTHEPSALRKVSKLKFNPLTPSTVTRCTVWYSVLLWPRGLRRRFAAARLLRLWIRIPQGACMSVCWECLCCQVEVSATSWSLVQGSPTDCAA